MGQDAGNWKLDITRCRVNIHLGVLHAQPVLKKDVGCSQDVGSSPHSDWAPTWVPWGPWGRRRKVHDSWVCDVESRNQTCFNWEIAPFRDDVATKKQSFVVDVPMCSSYKISNLHFFSGTFSCISCNVWFSKGDLAWWLRRPENSAFGPCCPHAFHDVL